MLKTLVGCCLKGFRAEHVQNPCRVLLKGLRKWAQPPYDQKVFKTERFRHDFVMVLHRYQLLESSRNREESRTFKLIVRCCLKGFGAEYVQNPRRVLLKGFRGGVMFKHLGGCCLKAFGKPFKQHPTGVLSLGRP